MAMAGFVLTPVEITVGLQESNPQLKSCNSSRETLGLTNQSSSIIEETQKLELEG